MVEQRPCNAQVTSSNLVQGFKHREFESHLGLKGIMKTIKIGKQEVNILTTRIEIERNFLRELYKSYGLEFLDDKKRMDLSALRELIEHDKIELEQLRKSAINIKKLYSALCNELNGL